MGFTGFYWVSGGFLGSFPSDLYEILLAVTRFYWVSMGYLWDFTGFY